MRILVLGAGAIGGYFGARLLAAGRNVTFLVRPQRAAQLAATGLVVHSAHGGLQWRDPQVVLASELTAPYDVVILSCKAYDLSEAMESMAPAVASHTLILPLLNGMAHLDRLDARFSAEQVLGGKCVISATVDESGAIHHLNALHSLSFGERRGGLSARVAALRAEFDGAGFEVLASEHIVQDMWEKWVFLATLAAATCLMRAPLGAIVAAPYGRTVIERLLGECLAIAASQGHAVADSTASNLRAVLTAAGSATTASMLRDIQRGARIEADQIVGDLLARAPAGQAWAGPGDSMLQLAWCHLKSYEASRG